MRKNKVKEIWAAGGAVVNGWLSINNSWSAEVMAHAGFDSLVIDYQHGFHSYSDALPMMQAISTTDTVPFVRVPWNDPIPIQRMLDFGAYGVICPMINTREECETFVASMRYFPDGIRSQGPTRARIYGGDDYTKHANNEIVAMAMVETATAMENLEEICSTPGLDGIYVGPGDLSLTLGGKQGVDFTDPELVAVLDRIYDACQRNGIAAGLHCSTPEYVKHMIGKGWQFLTIATDGSLLGRIASSSVKIAKGEIPGDLDISSVY